MFDMITIHKLVDIHFMNVIRFVNNEQDAMLCFPIFMGQPY